jgi:hypothetical protein
MTNTQRVEEKKKKKEEREGVSTVKAVGDWRGAGEGEAKRCAPMGAGERDVKRWARGGSTYSAPPNSAAADGRRSAGANSGTTSLGVSTAPNCIKPKIPREENIIKRNSIVWGETRRKKKR